MQVSETHVRTLKLQGLTESWESKRSGCVPEDLDRAKLEQARRGAGLAAWSDEAYLLKRKLADHRGARLELRHAAELLFASRGPDHANAGVRIFRVVGTERRTGAEHNVEERPRIEGSLSAVIEEATRAISGLLRRPSRLVGTRFRPVPEYPQFCWQEALLNAVAHRDYGDEGSGVEVWLFDDRMEIVSPGGFVGDLTLEEVLSLQRTHRSRNPRLMRVLVDLGVAREQGEGIPRMFAEMEDAFLPQPEIAVGRRSVTVTLRNTPTLTAGDRAFVARLGSTPVTDEEFRALLHAQRHGRVENADLRLLGGLDTLGASLLLRGLRDRGLLDLHAHGANSFYTVNALLLPSRESEAPAPDRGGLAPDRGGLVPDRGGSRRIGGGSHPIPGVPRLGRALARSPFGQRFCHCALSANGPRRCRWPSSLCSAPQSSRNAILLRWSPRGGCSVATPTIRAIPNRPIARSHRQLSLICCREFRSRRNPSRRPSAWALFHMRHCDET